MVPRCSRTLAYVCRVVKYKNSKVATDIYGFSYRNISRVASVEVPIAPCSTGNSYAAKSEGRILEQLVNLNKMFRTKPVSLALPPGSPHRINEPNYKGFRSFILRLMLFYSKQSIYIRAANVVYHRVVSQVEKPSLYNVLSLEKTFKTTFSMLVVHMWLCLRRLKVEGKEGVELGQYVYEIYNHDLEMRVSKAGVNLLLSKWMRDLEKVFYGNIIAYDTAMLPEAKQDEMHNAIWKNVFSDDGSPTYDAAALPAVLAFSRYVHRECTCLSLTEAFSKMVTNYKHFQKWLIISCISDGTKRFEVVEDLQSTRHLKVEGKEGVDWEYVFDVIKQSWLTDEGSKAGVSNLL